MKKLTLLFITLTIAYVSLGSDCNPPPPQNRSFSIHTLDDTPTFVGRQILDHPDEDVQGFWINDNGSAVGLTKNFRVLTNGTGRYAIDDGRVPARWNFAVFNGPGAVRSFCAGLSFNDDVTPGKEQLIVCHIPNSPFFLVSPSDVDLQSPPASFTITGDGIDATYGMPLIDYYDQSGTLVAEATATSVASDGTWLQANTPDLSAVYSGTYIVVVRTASSDGSYELVGTAPINATGRDPSLGCDPDGWLEQSCMNSNGVWDPSNCQCSQDSCGAGRECTIQ